MKPTIKEVIPNLIDLLLNLVPQFSSTTSNGVGKLQTYNKAKSVASVKFPEIIPLPDVIGSLIFGALTISPSKTIVIFFLHYQLLSSKLCAPNLSRAKSSEVHYFGFEY